MSQSVISLLNVILIVMVFIVCSCGWYCGRDIVRIGWIWERVFALYSFVDYAFDRSFSVDDDIG